jgi:hypothetical protein
VAQCPACASKGSDLIGRNHLIVYPNGSYGCVLYPGSKGMVDRERDAHLKTVFALVGVKDGTGDPKPAGRKYGPVYGCVPTKGKMVGTRRMLGR